MKVNLKADLYSSIKAKKQRHYEILTQNSQNYYEHGPT